MSKWNPDITDQINKTKLEEQKKLEDSFLNSEMMSLKMKTKLKEYLIEKAKEGDYK